ncbi:DUF5753 domain-containing protein [Streptomyces sp. NPDC046374]|uniref:DUF5753 domain-containing protein n=1 Tax=Streptomyces sp. NPDC046374 TaxID=3154917 RepID=UPI0033F1F01B
MTKTQQKRATPTVMRRRVGGQLRRWRGDMPSGTAAKKMGWDSVKLGRIERGLYRISADEVRQYAGDVLAVDDAIGIEAVAEAAEEPVGGGGWWRAYENEISPALYDFVQLENRARTVRLQHGSIVPGPLQSPAYVREIITRSTSTVTPKMAEVLIAVRLARQEILTRTEKPVHLHAIVPESAFHTVFESGPSIMRDQLRKLIDLSALPNITLQILPLTAHPTFGSNGASTMLTFDHPWASVASVDNPMGGTHTEEPKAVSYLENEFKGISSAALPVDKSREVLTEYLEGTTK